MEKSLTSCQREALFIARKRPLQIKKGVSLILLKSLPKPLFIFAVKERRVEILFKLD